MATEVSTVMKLQRCALLAVACAGLNCRTAEVAQPITPAQLCARRDTVRLQIPGTTLDDDFEIIARLLPGGFGGLATSYFFLKQPALADTARGTARTLAACPGETLTNLWAIVQSAPIRQGQYDWVELRRWYMQLINDGSGGMYMSDIDESINRLAFAFATQAALDAFRARAQAIGVPTAALSLSIGTPPVPASIATRPSN